MGLAVSVEEDGSFCFSLSRRVPFPFLTSEEGGMGNMSDNDALVGVSLVVVLVRAKAMAAAVMVMVVKWLGGMGTFVEIVGYFCSCVFSCC